MVSGYTNDCVSAGEAVPKTSAPLQTECTGREDKDCHTYFHILWGLHF